MSQQVDNSKITYDFTEEIANLDKSPLKNRMNQTTNYTIGEQFLKREEPDALIGDVIRMNVILGKHEEWIGKEVLVAGWVKTARSQQNNSLVFVELNDGSCLKGIQLVIEKDLPNFQDILKINTGFSIKVKGTIVESPAKGQTIEMSVKDVTKHYVNIIGSCDNKAYPLAKKHHTVEYLREQAHLRPRSNLIGAVTRIRNSISYATHIFYQTNGFLYIHTPLITSSDCEGAGELFQISTIMPEKESVSSIPLIKDTDKIDYQKDFFKKPAFLTCSGQLNVETYCCALSNTYTFGPAFRAENSHTSRHIAEFWIIEPEIAFADLFDDMDLGEAYIKFCLSYVLKNNLSDLQFIEQRNKQPLITYLESLIKDPFERITYTDAVKILKKAEQQGAVFEFKPVWGEELSTQHERFLTEIVFKRPVIVYNYPKKFKAFYMKLNDDKETVASMDILAPGVGEVIGGSQREERLDVLEERIKESGLGVEGYWWYLDLRRYGSVPHSGFGLGLERLVMVAAGQENIREVIPFPRYPGNAEF